MGGTFCMLCLQMKFFNGEARSRERPRMYELGTCLKNVDVAKETIREDLMGRLHLEGD